jgi:hypothetical protein
MWQCSVILTVSITVSTWMVKSLVMRLCPFILLGARWCAYSNLNNLFTKMMHFYKQCWLIPKNKNTTELFQLPFQHILNILINCLYIMCYFLEMSNSFSRMVETAFCWSNINYTVEGDPDPHLVITVPPGSRYGRKVQNWPDPVPPQWLWSFSY